MANFDYLKDFDVKSEESQKYEMGDIRMNDKVPFLMVKPATEANKPFARAQLLRSNKRIKSTGGRGVSLETIEGSRDDDRELYPRFVITGWGNVFDTSKKEITFSVRECEEFLTALPNWIFDGLRSYCTNPQNFSALDESDIAAAGE